MSEFRKSPRCACVVPVDGKIGSFFDSSHAVDVSKGGLGLISRQQIPINKEIPIELELTEGSDPVFVIGKVQWIQKISANGPYRIGVLFKDVLKGSKSRLNQYFKENS